MEYEEDVECWADLPQEIIQCIAAQFGASTKFSNNKYTFAQMRLVCKSWALAFPIDGSFGDIYIHHWEEEMDKNDFAQNVIAARITAPAVTQGAGVFFTAALACSNLRSLMLDNVEYEALEDLKLLSRTLEKLKARVLWPKLPDGYSLDQPQQLGWFEWASCLAELTSLEILPLNNPTYIGIKEIVESLPTKLENLRLCQVVAPCDLKAANFTHLTNLQFLSIRHCNFETSEIRELQAVLPHFYGIECTQRTSKNVRRLLKGKGEPSGTCGLRHLHLCINFSYEESETFNRFRKKRPRQLSPKLNDVFVSFSGTPYCLLRLFDFSSSSPNLESLNMTSSVLNLEDAVANGAQLGSLRSLTIKGHHMLENYYFSSTKWPFMHQLTELDLNCKCMSKTFEENFPLILGIMNNLKRLRLDSLQGSVSILGPVAEMEELHTLQLHNCTLEDLYILKHILKARGTSLQELAYNSKTCNGCIYKVLAQSLPEMPRLKTLHVHEYCSKYFGAHSICPESSLHVLHYALAECTNLVDLRVNPIFKSPHPRDGPLPSWNEIAELTRLRSLSISTTSGWNVDSLSAVSESLIYLQDLCISDGGKARSKIVDPQWMFEVIKLPLLKELQLKCCTLLKLPEDLKSLAEAPSLMILSIIGNDVFFPHAVAERVEEILPNIQKCNIIR